MKQTGYLTLTLAVVLVIALVYQVMDYNRQQQKQTAYNFQIESLAYTLSTLPEPEPDLEEKMAETRSANSAALRALSDDSITSTTIIDLLMGLAEGGGVEISPIRTDAWTTKLVGQSSYEILPIDLQVQGTLAEVIDYIQSIDNSQQYPYLLIAGIDLLTFPVESGAGTENKNPIIANISVNYIVRSIASGEELN